MSGSSAVRFVANNIIHGGGDALAAADAAEKAIKLGDILQKLCHNRNIKFNKREISREDVVSAISWAKENEEGKASYFGGKATAKFAVGAGLMGAGAAGGSIVPVAGTILGAAGGHIGGLVVGGAIDSGELVWGGLTSVFGMLAGGSSLLEQCAFCLRFNAAVKAEKYSFTWASIKAIQVLANGQAINDFLSEAGHQNLCSIIR